MNKKPQLNRWRAARGTQRSSLPGTPKFSRFHPRVAWLCLLLSASLSAQAQWLTQSIPLQPGWNAVFLHVDPSYDTLQNLVAADVSNPILEVWLWRPAPATVQFVQDPQAPNNENSQWSSWNRLSSGSSQLQRLVPNAAYLVRVATNVASYTWILKGQPIAPRYQWTTTGLNLLGFPTVPDHPPTFEAFLAQTPELKQNIELYQYVGGDLGPLNPARLFALRTTPVQRGQAFWLRSGTYFNRYYGPIEVVLTSGRKIDFLDTLSTATFRLRNLAPNSLTVTAELVASEAPPTGQTAISGVPPLVIRGPLNTANLTFTCTNLPVGEARVWTLAGKGQPGSEVEVVLGLNRSALNLEPGSLVAATLRLTDSLGHSEVHVPVAATVASNAGLWVGNVQLTEVGQYLKTYQLGGDRLPILDTNGQYIVTSLSTNSAAVPRSFPLRLIVHNPPSGNAVLLQRVYCGLDASTNYIVASSESPLNADYREQARRITAVHLPWTATNTAWVFDGNLGAETVTTTILVDDNDHASNPFLHTYHPDHDNLNPTFQSVLPQGAESYTIQRDITLTKAGPASDFDSLTSSGQALAGEYRETITLLGLARGGGTEDSQRFQVRGRFSLQHLSNIPVVTRVP